jgi:hypothetical protein
MPADQRMVQQCGEPIKITVYPGLRLGQQFRRSVTRFGTGLFLDMYFSAAWFIAHPDVHG